jgi:hypothetical protein
MFCTIGYKKTFVYVVDLRRSGAKKKLTHRLIKDQKSLDTLHNASALEIYLS